MKWIAMIATVVFEIAYFASVFMDKSDLRQIGTFIIFVMFLCTTAILFKLDKKESE